MTSRFLSVQTEMIDSSQSKDSAKRKPNYKAKGPSNSSSGSNLNLDRSGGQSVDGTVR